MNDQVIQTPSEPVSGDATRKTRLIVAGGILGALASSSCCVIPLTLFSLGVSGAWIGQLTALAPYQPIFVVITLVFLGYGYWMVYGRPKANCTEDTACSSPLPDRIVKSALWFATALIALALAWPYVVPLILD